MGKVTWIKITTDIFDDEKIQLIESMPDSDTIIVIWFKLLALAGKSNNNGFIVLNENVPYTMNMLETMFRRKKSVIKLAMDTFEAFGMVEIIDDKYLISNWEKHQNIAGLDKIREQNRLRQQEFRDRHKNKEIEYKNKSKDKEIDIEGNVTNNVTHNVTKNKYYKNESLNNIFNEFLDLRKKLKAKNSERAITLLINKLEEYDDSVKIKMIEESIMNSWKSVFPLKKDFNNNKPKSNKAEENDMFDRFNV